MKPPKELLKILACPKCRSNFKYAQNKLICIKCKKNYEIKKDIPILIREELIRI